MTTILHLSDLHFGPGHNAQLAQLILNDIAALNPDMVIISGDFTMRARPHEYEHARDFLQKISKPLLTIPGNHDQPLVPITERLTRAYARYQEYIHPTVDAACARAGIFAIGVNDNRPILPGGFWSRAQREWIETQARAAQKDAVKILATHHQVDWSGMVRPLGFWFPARALQFLARNGVEIVLNGHTHVPSAVQSREGIVIARAGTATSSRTRHGNRNAYNLIAIDPHEIRVTVREYDLSRGKFADAREWKFARRLVKT
ncbi:MAG: metallophosphoesterase [Chloroflexi bacterium]|nr:metallophosphoesterase [Chloroflexota bacterium]